MPPQKPKFGLFFTENPPSADVLRVDQFQPVQGLPHLDIGQERTVLKGKKKDKVKGRILRTGTQTALRRLHVTSAGAVHEEVVEGTVYVPSYAAALNQVRKARENNLSTVDDLLFREGPQGSGAVEAPATARTPIKRSRESLEIISAKINSLPCFEERPGDVQLNECSRVFMNGSLLHYYYRSYRGSPQKLFRKILKHLLPQELLKDDGFSLEGGGDTVAIPDELISAITAYVSTNTDSADEHAFSPQTILASYIYNNRDDIYKRRSTAPRRGTAGSSSRTTHTTTRSASSNSASSTSPSSASPSASSASISAPSTATSSSTSEPVWTSTLPSGASSDATAVSSPVLIHPQHAGTVVGFQPRPRHTVAHPQGGSVHGGHLPGQGGDVHGVNHLQGQGRRRARLQPPPGPRPGRRRARGQQPPPPPRR
ncbi:Lamin-A, partial [Frankliniella fusca]